MAKSTRDREAAKALVMAAGDCNVSLTADLLARGANPNCFAHGMTPLISAELSGGIREQTVVNGEVVPRQNDPFETVKVLLQAGADPELPQRDGTTPLMCSLYSIEVAKLLLTKVKNVDAQLKSFGKTALMLVAGNGCIEHVQLLLDCGASVNVVTLEGKTAFDEADRYPAIRELIAKHGGVTGASLDLGKVMLAKKAEDDAREERRIKRLQRLWPTPNFEHAADSESYRTAIELMDTICSGFPKEFQGKHREFVSYETTKREADRIVEEFQGRLRAVGAFLFASGQATNDHAVNFVSILPTKNVYEAICAMGTNRNDGIGPAAVCAGLSRISKLASFTIRRITYDRLEGTWDSMPNPKRLAKELFTFCSDSGESARDIKRTLERTNQLFLWWD